MRYALRFGYDGKEFSGYVRQPGLKTVEGDIIMALDSTTIISSPAEARFQSASRTDKGVSARGNVMALDTNFRKDEILGALNSHLKNIWFYGITEVKEQFNPRHAIQRWYRYLLQSNDIDPGKLREAAGFFQGEHDFSNFARLEDRNPVRTLERIEITREGDMLILDFYAQSFSWHMVRRIVSAVADYSRGHVTVEEIQKALDADERLDLGLAPPGPLILMDVKYDFDIPVDRGQFERIGNEMQGRLLEMEIRKTLIDQMKSI